VIDAETYKFRSPDLEAVFELVDKGRADTLETIAQLEMPDPTFHKLKGRYAAILEFSNILISQDRVSWDKQAEDLDSSISGN
jgi:hypothetical protein